MIFFRKQHMARCARVALAVAWAAAARGGELAAGDPYLWGGRVAVPIQLSSGGEEVSGLQFDIAFDSSLYSVSEVVLGGGAMAANKQPVLSDGVPGTARVLVTGFNQDVIPDGEVATVYLTPTGTGLETDAFYLSGVQATDPFAYPVTLESPGADTPAPEQPLLPDGSAALPPAASPDSAVNTGGFLANTADTSASGGYYGGGYSPYGEGLGRAERSDGPGAALQHLANAADLGGAPIGRPPAAARAMGAMGAIPALPHPVPVQRVVVSPPQVRTTPNSAPAAVAETASPRLPALAPEVPLQGTLGRASNPGASASTGTRNLPGRSALATATAAVFITSTPGAPQELRPLLLPGSIAFLLDTILLTLIFTARTWLLRQFGVRRVARSGDV